MKKKTSFKLLSLVISLCIILSSIAGISVFAANVWNGSVSNSLGGAGTQNDPYKITNGADLAYISQQVAGGNDFSEKYFALTNDIVLNNNHENYATWGTTAPANMFTPIGNNSKWFRGTEVDGKGYTVYGLYVSGSASDTTGMGLFGGIHNAKIKDLKIRDSYVKGYQNVGGIVGVAQGSTLNNCSFDGYIYSTNVAYAGGACGGILGIASANTVNVTQCSSSGVMDAYGRHGGLVGSVTGGTLNISNSYSVMDLTNFSMHPALGSGNYWEDANGVGYPGSGVGGILGFCDSTTTIKNSFYAGEFCRLYLNNENRIGPIVGMDNGITNNVAPFTGTPKATGTNCYYITDCSANGYGKCGQYKTAAEFADGTVKALLGKLFDQGETTPVFYSLDGDGTNSSPYIVSTADDLDYIAAATNLGFDFFDRRILQSNDIVYNTNHESYASWETTAPENLWTPIGNNSNYFRGYFDGGNYSIYGLYTKFTGTTGAAVNGTGMFGAVHNHSVKNVHVKDSYFYAYQYLGGIVGFVQGTELNNCSFEGYIHSSNTGSSSGAIGGLVGAIQTSNAYIKKCYTAGALDAYGRHGGLVGSVISGQLAVENSYCVMDLTNFSMHPALGSDYWEDANGVGYPGAGVGGILGFCGSTTTIKNSFYAGEFCGLYLNNENRMGPIVGMDSGITNNVAPFTGTPKATGTNCYYITDCSADGYGKCGQQKTAVEFANGTVAELLGGMFEQGEDGYPVFSKPDLEGNGTKANPYIVSDIEDFEEINRLVLGGNNLEGLNFRLANDITLNADSENYESWKTTAPANEWEPIGSQAKPFAGNFDGANYTVYGMYIDDDTTPTGYGVERAHGFFGFVYRGTIKNLNIKNSFVAANRVVGGMAGLAQEATFKNCSFDGYVFGYNTANANGSAGGLVGYLNGGNTFYKCYTAGTLDSYSRAGGLVGSSPSNSKNNISDCYSVMDLTGHGTQSGYGQGAGGLVGFVQNGTMIVENSFFAGTYPTESTSAKGPIIGANYGTCECNNCYYLGDADGLFGDCYDADEFADGTVLAKLQNESNNVWIQGETTPIFTIMGDVNCDAVIDIGDAILIVRHIEEIQALSTDAISLADMDGDGSITLSDYDAVKSFALNAIEIENVLDNSAWSLIG